MFVYQLVSQLCPQGGDKKKDCCRFVIVRNCVKYYICVLKWLFFGVYFWVCFAPPFGVSLLVLLLHSFSPNLQREQRTFEGPHYLEPISQARTTNENPQQTTNKRPRRQARSQPTASQPTTKSQKIWSLFFQIRPPPPKNKGVSLLSRKPQTA